MAGEWIAVVGTLAGGIVGFAGQAYQAGRQRGWQAEDLDRQDAVRRESDLRLIRLQKYEELSSVAARTLVAMLERSRTEAEVERHHDGSDEHDAALAKHVAAMGEAIHAYGDLMGMAATVELIAGPDVREAVDNMNEWLTDALTRSTSEGWADVLTDFNPRMEAAKAAMRVELAGQ